MIDKISLLMLSSMRHVPKPIVYGWLVAATERYKNNPCDKTIQEMKSMAMMMIFRDDIEKLTDEEFHTKCQNVMAFMKMTENKHN